MSYIRGQGRGRGSLATGSSKIPLSTPGKRRDAASAEQRFKEASRVHNEAVEKHLDAQQKLPATEPSEPLTAHSVDDEDVTDEMLRKMTASYNKDAPNNAGEGVDTHSILDMVMNEDSNVCLVCLDSIERAEAIWNCSSCCCTIHLGCIQQWINEGSYQQKQSTLSEQHFPNKRVPWHCPKCRAEFPHNEFPAIYKCFCGQMTNPVDDPWLLPHSCGESCRKHLKPECGHLCLLLCHPGPCPPCPKSVTVSCYCGNSASISRRCGSKSWSCGRPCRKTLECGAHQCDQNCHRGNCSPCAETSVQSCLCGLEKQNRPCSQPTWSCQQRCGQVLSCGHHYCHKVCHKKGDCGECARSGARRLCPCGKTPTLNLPCTEDVPCCGDTCGKPLACEQHQCTEKCHYDNCSQCLQVSVKTCRCGAKQKEMPCAKTFTCDTRCQNMKACGRHLCKRRCCDGISCSSCDQICGKKLKCGNHKCISSCHGGPCYPCTVTIDKACNCAKTVVSVPCIRQKTALPPKCRRPCLTKSKCDHPAIQKHACHFGSCPPCDLVCGKNLSGCKHSCVSRCHDSMNVKIQSEKKVLAGPWEQQAPTYNTLQRKPCPPCPRLGSVTCKGGHETSELPCSSSQIYSCNRECGKVLACTNHTCTMECHMVTGNNSQSTVAGAECLSCEESCSHIRPKGCSHPCLKPCHPGKCPPCTQAIKTRCFCTVTVLYIPCHEWTDVSFSREERLRCPGLCPKELGCGHPCSQQCHPPGQCQVKCTKKVTLRCKCKTIKQSMACHLTADKTVECSERCEEQRQHHSADTDQGSHSEAPDEDVDSSILLPGRRQRKRKNRQISETVANWAFPWQLVKKSALIISVAMSVSLAFYFAITADN